MPGVYLSYPFCAQKCTYCNFASGVFPRDLEARYLDALKQEISAHPWQWTPDTVYFGGGTPSTLDPTAFTGLLSLLPGRPWREATLEAAPGTITAARASGWTEAGINRVSLGVQSFVEREIRLTGRKHDSTTVAAEIAILRDAGISSINIDLIAGLSAQTEASWRESLDWIERLAPEHVSVYMLEVDEDSRLGKEMLLGGVRYGAGDTPTDDQTASFYEIAVERLAAIGIPRYEISNFARPCRESLHNLKYWTLQPYVGFGADAHSYDGASRYANPESPQEYTEHPSTNPRPPAPGPQPRSDERLFLGLRLAAGIRLTPEEWRVYAAPIDRFLADGLLETSDGALRLTDRGVLLSNEVFQEFLAA